MSNEEKPPISQAPVIEGYYPAGLNQSTISVNTQMVSGYAYPLIQAGTDQYTAGIQATYDSNWTGGPVTVSITAPSGDWEVWDQNEHPWTRVPDSFTWTHQISGTLVADVVSTSQSDDVEFYWYDTLSRRLHPVTRRQGLYDPAIHITPPQ
jgi:hypothetical protein